MHRQLHQAAACRKLLGEVEGGEADTSWSSTCRSLYLPHPSPNFFAWPDWLLQASLAADPSCGGMARLGLPLAGGGSHGGGGAAAIQEREEGEPGALETSLL